MWNLPAPEGFRGLDPHAPVTIYHRHLPHWRQEGATYTVTFRQADSLPQSRLEELRRLRKNWEARHPEPRGEAEWEAYAREFTRRVDAWLDEGYGSCLFSERAHVDLLAEAMTRFHGNRYHTGAYAIMPNHCHLLIRPFAGEPFEKLLQSIKGVVSREIQWRRGRQGERLWEQESYDRIIRDEEHLAHAIDYIGRNPEQAGLGSERTWRCWIAPEWAEAGWHFDAFGR